MRIFLTLLFSLNLVYSCALCALMVPTAHINLNFDIKDERLKEIGIEWYFSTKFTNTVLSSYDINADGKFSKEELEEVTLAIEEYATSLDMLMSFDYFYTNNIENEKKLVGKYSDFKSYIVDDRLVFSFKKVLEKELKVDESLVIVSSSYDPGEFFNFFYLSSLDKKIKDGLFLIQNPNLSTNFISFNKATHNKIVKPISEQLDQITNEKESLFDTFIWVEKLKSTLLDSDNSPTFLNIILVIAVSFGYGFFHAAGPGHAKVLTSSYFLTNAAGYKKALFFALKVGFIHTIAAFVMVSVSYFALASISESLKMDRAVLITKISSLTIIFIALFIIFKKLSGLKKEDSCSCHCCEANHNKSDWLVAVSSAIIPCPGTILVFVFAFGMTNYVIAIVSALFMSLGMSVVIFVSALFGSKINGLKWLQNYKIYVELFGATLMFAIGFFLYLISDRIGVL